MPAVNIDILIILVTKLKNKDKKFAFIQVDEDVSLAIFYEFISDGSWVAK